MLMFVVVVVTYSEIVSRKWVERGSVWLRIK